MRAEGTVLIIGGGIGGLATALALHQAGLRPLVFERAPELREVGSGLSLWPNALKALTQLGVAEAVRVLGIPQGRGAALRSWRGELLVDLDGENLERKLGEVTLVLHRAELLAALAAALDRDVVQLGKGCQGFTQDARGVAVDFADGTQGRGDVLIGADGLHSVVRAQLWGDRPPDYAGYTGWRAITQFEQADLSPGVSIGCGAQFGQAPMSQGRVYWFATQNLPPGEAELPGGCKPGLLRLFGAWHAPIPALIAATEATAILRTDLYDRPPLRRWGRDRVTLLGDAAHPMTPNLGQGACQALEDAVVLARCLGHTRDVVPALQAYEQQRLPRANAIVRQSRQAGTILQAENALVCRLRDAVLKTPLAARLQMRQLTQLAAFSA